jgi:hypothetical protein
METQLRQEAVERINIDADIAKIDHVQVANQFIAPYMEGWVSAEEMWAKLYHLKAIVEQADKMIKDRLVDDIATKYGKESAHCGGLEFKVKKGSGRWSYPNNPVIDGLKEKTKQAEELAKIAFRMRQEQVWVETGEVIPPAVYSENKDTLETKIK